MSYIRCFLKSKEIGVVRTGKNEEEMSSELQTNQFFDFRVHGLRKSTMISIKKAAAPTDYRIGCLADTNQNQKKILKLSWRSISSEV